MITETIESNQTLATTALELQKEISVLTEKLNDIKEDIRKLANGNKLEIIVENLGKVSVSSPREESSRVELQFDKEKVSKYPELKQKLLDTGIAKEEIVKVSAAKASVTIKPNV